MFKLLRSTTRKPFAENFEWENLVRNRAQAYLFKEFDDVNLEHLYIPLMGDELVDQIVSFFVEGSQLVYPAKSYFVAITYASFIAFWTCSTRDKFWSLLRHKNLLIDDKYFKPYGSNVQVNKIYEAAVKKLCRYMQDNGHKIDFLNIPEGEIWRFFKSCVPTLEYFFEEFLCDDEIREVTMSTVLYKYGGSDV